jgi:hypothetical protein
MLSLRALLHACSAAALVVAAACADPTVARVPPDAPVSQRLACRGTVAQRTVACAAPDVAGGLRADRLYGQGAGLKLTSSNLSVVADSFMFDMAVTSLLDYTIATTNGINADPNGVRVFFVDGIHTTSGTGAVTVANADGVGTFTAAGQAYFTYPGPLASGMTTDARRWKLRFDPGVETFSFGMYVTAFVPAY